MKESTWKIGTNLPVKLLLAAVIWVVMSVSGVMIGPLRCMPAVELWEYAASGQLAEEQFIKRAESTRFPAGSYQTYINPGTNANLAASNPGCAAAVYRSTLYFVHLNRLFSLDAKSPNEFTGIGGSGELEAMIAGKGCLLFFDTGSIRFLKSSGTFSHTLEEGNWLEAYQAADFATLADRLFELLNKQETSKLTGPELAALAYYTKEGVLLDYTDQAAWLADSASQPGAVTVYKQSAPGQREEVLHYQDHYTGLGAGRFCVDGLIVYADGGPLSICAMDGSFRFTVEGEGVNAPTQALNYVRSSDGTPWITYIDDGLVMHQINFRPDDSTFSHETVTLPASKDNGKLDGLFSADASVFALFTGSNGKTAVNTHTVK